MEAFWILLICLVALEKIKEEEDLLEQNYKKEIQKEYQIPKDQ